jgi:hypothetical protein
MKLLASLVDTKGVGDTLHVIHRLDQGSGLQH